MGRLSCTMPVCFSTLREPSKLESPYLITKATHAGSNRLLNDIETMAPGISHCIPYRKRKTYLYILPLSMVLVGAGACGEREGRLGSIAVAEELEVAVEYVVFR